MASIKKCGYFEQSQGEDEEEEEEEEEETAAAEGEDNAEEQEGSGDNTPPTEVSQEHLRTEIYQSQLIIFIQK